MSSRRSSEDPSAKRQKVYRACLGCVSSKTRCEDVRLEGCLRCRTKRKDCSLVESGAADLRQNSTDPGPFAAELESRIEATEEGWRMLSRRVDTLERGLYATANAPSGTSTSGLQQAPTPSMTPVPRPVGVSPMFSALNWSQLPLSETVFNLSSEEGFPDPVSRGLVTMDQMEMSFHLYVVLSFFWLLRRELRVDFRHQVQASLFETHPVGALCIIIDHTPIPSIPPNRCFSVHKPPARPWRSARRGYPHCLCWCRQSSIGPCPLDTFSRPSALGSFSGAFESIEDDLVGLLCRTGHGAGCDGRSRGQVEMDSTARMGK